MPDQIKRKRLKINMTHSVVSMRTIANMKVNMDVLTEIDRKI